MPKIPVPAELVKGPGGGGDASSDSADGVIVTADGDQYIPCWDYMMRHAGTLRAGPALGRGIRLGNLALKVSAGKEDGSG